MKIRTDFVTNSSSYSTAEVIINNPLLLEILQKYNAKGTFIHDPDFFMGNLGKDVHADLLDEYNLSAETPLLVSNPALDEYDFWNDVPNTLSEVVGSILYCIDEGWEIKDVNLYEQMTRELEEKSAEILLAFRKAIWKYESSYNEDEEYEYNGYLTDSKQFIFDPKGGEELVLKTEAAPCDDEEIDEGFIFKEKRLVNGEVVCEFDSLADDQDHTEWCEIRILHGEFLDEEGESEQSSGEEDEDEIDDDEL